MKRSLSRRAYARHRGVSTRSVQKRVDDGTLTAALDADGRIDSDIADSLLSQNTTGGAASSSGTLIEARRRKETASCALLADEVADYDASLVPRADADATTRNIAICMAKYLNTMGDEIAEEAAGQKAPAVLSIVDRIVFDTLTALSETKVVTEGAPPETYVAPPFGDMTLVELAAARANLQARLLELRRGRRRGDLIDVAPFGEAGFAKTMIVKNQILGLPSKLAPLLEHVSVAEARVLVAREIEQILENLACDAVGFEELLAAKDGIAVAKKPKQRKSK